MSARNSAPNSLATWNQASASGTPAGPPISVASPTASGSVTDGTTATIEWAGTFADNGKAISDYYVAMYTGSAPSCVVEGVEEGNPHLTAEPVGPGVQHVSASTTSATFTGLAANQTYKFTVFAHNGQGCTASPEVQATPRAAPGTVTNDRRGRPGRPWRRGLGLPARRADRHRRRRQLHLPPERRHDRGLGVRPAAVRQPT